MSDEHNISGLDIEKFFDGELSKVQITAFEEKMQVDALFAREVREHRQMRKDLRVIGQRLMLLELMDQFHLQEFGTTPYLKPKSDDNGVDNDKGNEESDSKEADDTVKRDTNRTSVVTLRTFYLSVGVAASLAAIITLGSVWVIDQAGGDIITSESGYQDLLMEEEAEEGKDTNSGRFNRKDDPAIMPVATKKYVATAFAVAKDGYFITNNHVVEGCTNLKLKAKVEDDKWIEFNAKVILNDQFSDLAMVQIEDSGFRELGVLPFTFSSKGALMGQDVFTLGYPKKDVVMEPGTISSTTGLNGDTTAYQLAMSLNSGNSGGPIFNSKGEVVAVVKGKHNGKEGTGYAVRIDYMLELIEKYESENSVTLKKPKYNQIQYKSRVKQISHIRQFVFLVEAEK